MSSPAVVFETDDGARVAARMADARRTVNGARYVWVRRTDGEITRAFHAGEIA